MKGWVTSGTEFRKILSPLPCQLLPSSNISHLMRHHYSEAKHSRIKTINGTTSPSSATTNSISISERERYMTKKVGMTAYVRQMVFQQFSLISTRRRRRRRRGRRGEIHHPGYFLSYGFTTIILIHQNTCSIMYVLQRCCIRLIEPLLRLNQSF